MLCPADGVLHAALLLLLHTDVSSLPSQIGLQAATTAIRLPLKRKQQLGAAAGGVLGLPGAMGGGGGEVEEEEEREEELAGGWISRAV